MATQQQSQKPPVHETGPQSKGDARRDAKADLASAKARAKAQRPLYKKPLVWIAGIIGLIIIFSALGSGGGENTDTAGGAGTAQNPAQDNAQQESTAGIGDKVTDGQFSFTVDNFECGATRIGSGFLAVEAQGQFCIANMTVENTGDHGQLLDASEQLAYIGDREYAASSEVVTASKEAESFFLENINPGNSVKGIVVWDVPKGQQPDRFELHDSFLSGGVTVEP